MAPLVLLAGTAGALLIATDLFLARSGGCAVTLVNGGHDRLLPGCPSIPGLGRTGATATWRFFRPDRGRGEGHAENGAGNFRLDSGEQPGEHFIGLALVLDQWVTLPGRLQADSLAHVVHRRQMLDPFAVDVPQHDGPFQRPHRLFAEFLRSEIVEGVCFFTKNRFDFDNFHFRDGHRGLPIFRVSA